MQNDMNSSMLSFSTNKEDLGAIESSSFNAPILDSSK